MTSTTTHQDSLLFQQIAQTFRQAMMEQGVTQTQLVEKTGLTARTVCLLLSGKQNFKVSSLGLIANALGLELTMAPKATPASSAAETSGAAPVAKEVLPLSAYAPGARVLEHMVRRFGGTMSPSLALAQWEAVSKVLRSKRMRPVIAEALESTSGSLDTLPRSDVMDAWGLVCVGRPWPANMDGEEAIDAFIAAWGQYLKDQGACTLPKEETVL